LRTTHWLKRSAAYVHMYVSATPLLRREYGQISAGYAMRSGVYARS
jgi:hypothetical protein